MVMPLQLGLSKPVAREGGFSDLVFVGFRSCLDFIVRRAHPCRYVHNGLGRAVGRLQC